MALRIDEAIRDCINLAKGRIADLSSLAVSNGFADLEPRLIHGSLDQNVSAPKRHLDQFSRFCVHRTKVPRCFSVGRTTPNIAPFPWRT